MRAPARGRPRRARSSARRRSPPRAAPRRTRSDSSCGNSSTPESARKHLKPKTPSSCSGRRSLTLPGMAPPQKPTSMKQLSCAALRFTSSAATSTVGGRLFNGMSMMVVTPPAAAALVALAKPSHSVRPGSLTCTWVSTRPGSSTSSSASRNSCLPARSVPNGSMATIVPPRTPTVHRPRHRPRRLSRRGSPGRRSSVIVSSNPSRCRQLIGGNCLRRAVPATGRHRPCSAARQARYRSRL